MEENTTHTVVTKDLPISPWFTPYDFLSRCKFSTLTTRQPMVEFYSLTFPRFPLQTKEHKSYFGKNRTHRFRTSRCAGYLLDHSGDEGLVSRILITKIFNGLFSNLLPQYTMYHYIFYKHYVLLIVLPLAVFFPPESMKRGRSAVNSASCTVGSRSV